MAYRVTITKPAREDYLDYVYYINVEKSSPQAAKRWMDGLLATIRSLKDNPTRFSRIPEADELLVNYRSVNYHSHRIIFEVDEEAGRVLIHRVYHSARRPLKPE